MKLALPALRVPLPMVTVPSLKVTVPVGVPPVELTAALKVTAAPNVDGFNDELSAVELLACVVVKLRIDPLAVPALFVP